MFRSAVVDLKIQTHQGFTTIFHLNLALIFLCTVVNSFLMFISVFLIQSPLHRKLWGPVRRYEPLNPDANPREYYPGKSLLLLHLFWVDKGKFSL